MEAQAPLRVAEILGSTREGRICDTVGHWFAAQAGKRDDVELSIVDLADFEFPARYPKVATPQMMRFTTAIGRAEAFVFVTPEYNRSFPAPLKQAVDYAYDEWRAKPVGFVSYGCGSTGLYAVEQLRTILVELHTVAVRDSVGLDLMGCDFATSRQARDPDHAERATTAMLDQLTWWGLALRDARAARPYVC